MTTKPQLWEAVFNAHQDKGLTAALLTISQAWALEIKNQPRTEFIGGISNCIEALNEIAIDIQQATLPPNEDI